MLGEAHALGQDDTKPIEKCGLSRVGVSDAAQTNLTVGCGRQHNVVRLNACEFFEDRTWRVSEAGALLPHLEALPQHEGEEAHEDMDLKRAPIGANLEDYDVLEDGVIVDRILFISAAGPADRQWMWASGHNGDIIRRAAHGYEPTREEAMQAFARSWHRE